MTVRLTGLNDRLVINRHKGCGEIYSNDWTVSMPTQFQRIANIRDYHHYRDAVDLLDCLVRANPVPVPEDIAQLELLPD